MDSATVAAKLDWTSAKLEAEVKLVQDKFAGLITREGALEIILRKNGQAVVKEQPQVAYDKISDITAITEGSMANFAARAMHAYPPKLFVRKTEGKGERHGKVSNIEVSDGSGTLRFVLWNKDADLVESGAIERNDVLLVRNALVKKNQGNTELHSQLTTRTTILKEGDWGDYAGIPQNPAKPIALKEARAGQVDCFGRIMESGVATEFTRNREGRQELGLRCTAAISDGTATARVVAWDENAKYLERCKIGEAVKIEGGVVKPREGGFEIHLNWQSRVIRNPKNHALPERADMLKNTFPKELLGEAAENKEAIVTAKLVELRSATYLFKCPACGNRLNDAATPCACGAKERKTTLMLKTIIDDGTANMACTFFDETALEALEVGELTVEPQAVLEIKRDYLLGDEIVMLLRYRKNQYGELEATCRQVVQRHPDVEEEIVFNRKKAGLA